LYKYFGVVKEFLHRNIKLYEIHCCIAPSSRGLVMDCTPSVAQLLLAQEHNTKYWFEGCHVACNSFITWDEKIKAQSGKAT